MKKTLTTRLGGAALLALFVLAITHFTSCGSRANSPARIVVPVPIRHNSGSPSGSGTDSIPHIVISNPVALYAGSTLVVECASKDCAGKILFEFRIPNDLPRNTEMSLSFRPAPGTK